MIDQKLLQLLVCPVSGGALSLAENSSELWCKMSSLAYPIEQGIPVLLKSSARKLTSQEQASLIRRQR